MLVDEALGQCLNHEDGTIMNRISVSLSGLLHSIVVLEKTLESPSDSKEIQPVHPKGKQS